MPENSPPCCSWSRAGRYSEQILAVPEQEPAAPSSLGYLDQDGRFENGNVPNEVLEFWGSFLWIKKGVNSFSTYWGGGCTVVEHGLAESCDLRKRTDQIKRHTAITKYIATIVMMSYDGLYLWYVTWYLYLYLFVWSDHRYFSLLSMILQLRKLILLRLAPGQT